MANRKFYHRHRSASKGNFEKRASALERYGEQQLTLTLEQLGLGAAAIRLLSSSGISTAADLVVRTEKDLYKVQGLNKKVLNEVKNALRANDMELYEEPAPADAPAEADVSDDRAPKQPQSGKRQPQRSDGGKGDAPQKEGEDRPSRDGASKFGLADRRGAGAKQPQKQQPRPSRTQERITEPLPVELWRKVLKGGKWGFSDGFKTVIPPMYDEVFSFKEGLASVEIDGKCGFIDSQNNVVVPLEYDLAMSFSEGLAMVARGDKCGYINKDNVVVIDFLYDAASPFEGGEAKVKKDGKWATLTPDGKLTWI